MSISGNSLYKKLISYGLGGALALSGAFLIGPWEGKENMAYLDPVDIYTICYGSTRGVKRGDYKTDEQCFDLLARDLIKHDRQMMKHVKVPLKDYQHAAFLSFCYNVGVGKCSSSTVFKLLNKKDYSGACHQLSRWVYAGGKRLNGLVSRRQAELKICLGELPNEISKQLEKTP